jgi:cytochrome P450
VGQAFETTLQQITHRARHPFSAPDFVPTPRNRRFKAALRTLDHFIYALIDDRRRGNVQNEDLLTILLNADDPETGETMSDHQLRDEVLTLLFGGHETTAILLTWSFYLLSKFPEVAKRLRRELADVLGGNPPTVDDLGDLQYTRRVLEETLRIYPPIWSTSRRSIEAETIGGYHIPGGAMIGPSPYAIHRHPDFWENPEGFDPNRFTPECIADRPRYAYIPFGGGPRICIGRHFAMMEAMLILATVAQRYRLDLVPEHPVELAILATLRPRYGMLMTLHPID